MSALTLLLLGNCLYHALRQLADWLCDLQQTTCFSAVVDSVAHVVKQTVSSAIGASNECFKYDRAGKHLAHCCYVLACLCNPNQCFKLVCSRHVLHQDIGAVNV